MYSLVASKSRTNMLPPSARYKCRPEDFWHEESMESDHGPWVWTKCISSVLDSTPVKGDSWDTGRLATRIFSLRVSSKPSYS